MIIYFALFIAFLKNLYVRFYPQDYDILVINVKNKTNQLKVILEPKLMTLGYNIGYNIVYLYSKYQIYFNKFILFINPYYTNIQTSIISVLKKHNLINKMDIQIMTFYKNGNGFNNIIYNKKEGFNYVLEDLKDCDLLILSDKNENTSCINKIHYTKYPRTIEYITSDIKFMSVELSYNNKTYPIDLRNNNHNHYIVSNILNIHFFKYYLINVLNVEICDEFAYSVCVIDHNANIIELNSTSHLVIQKNDYEFICNDTGIHNKPNTCECKDVPTNESECKDDPIFDEYVNVDSLTQ